MASVCLTNRVIRNPSSDAVTTNVSSPVSVSVGSCAVSPQSSKSRLKIRCSSLKMTVCLKTNGIAVTRFSPNKPNIRGPDSKMLLFPPLISSLCRLGGLYPSAGAESFATRFPPARLPIASSEIQLRNKNSFGPGKGIDKTRVNLIIVAHRRKGRVCFERFKVRDCGKKLCFKLEHSETEWEENAESLTVVCV